MRDSAPGTIGRPPAPVTPRGGVPRRTLRGRAGHWGAASLAGAIVLALVAGCGGAAAPATRQPSANAAGSGGGASARVAAGPAAPAAAAAQQLAAALESLRPGYAFNTVVSVGGQVAARVSFFNDTATTEMTIESGETTIAYRMLPPRSFVRQPDGTWVEADGQVPDGDPLAALLAPVSITALPGGGGIAATYPAKALGLPGDQPATVSIRTAADGTVSATWTATVAGREAVSTAVLGPASGAPILDPTAP